MDRSYPYSRRLMSRSRLHQRIVAMAAAGLVGATALFMFGWSADPISAAVAPQAGPLLAFGSATSEAEPRKLRRIYPYSVVPGGVSGQAELARVIRTDRVVATHYAGFDVDKAHPVVVAKPRAVHVSYRKDGKVYWTARKVMLAAGETLLSDGRNEMRARCANRISDVPQYPVEAHQPSMHELDNPVEVEDGAKPVLGLDGLPVAADATIEQSGPRFQISGGNGFLGAATPAPGDDRLAGSGPAPGAGWWSPPITTSVVGSSGSVGGRPRPDAELPLAPPADASIGEGASGSSSGSPLPGGVADTPAPTPAPGFTPDPNPAPLPAATLPTVFTPDPLPQPNGEQSGGGGTAELPPAAPPGPGPLFPGPGTVTEPFIPKPELAPPPGTNPVVEEREPPAGVPEPGSLALGAIGLAALAILRRRPGCLKRES